jgi:hypothetical protein
MNILDNILSEAKIKANENDKLRIILRAWQYERSNKHLTDKELYLKVIHMEAMNIDPKLLTLN